MLAWLLAWLVSVLSRTWLPERERELQYTTIIILQGFVLCVFLYHAYYGSLAESFIIQPLTGRRLGPTATDRQRYSSVTASRRPVQCRTLGTEVVRTVSESVSQ